MTIYSENDKLLRLYGQKIEESVFCDAFRPELELRKGNESDVHKNDGFGLVVSNYNLFLCNDMEESLVKVHDSLKEDGCFTGSLFGSETLKELRNAFYIAENERFGGYGQHLLKFPEVNFFSNSLNRIGFTMASIVNNLEEQQHDNLFELLDAIKDNGLGNCFESNNYNISKDLFIATASVYQSLYYHKTNKDKLCSTVESLFFIGYKRAEGQMKRGKRDFTMQGFKSYLEDQDDDTEDVVFGHITEEGDIIEE